MINEKLSQDIEEIVDNRFSTLSLLTARGGRSLISFLMTPSSGKGGRRKLMDFALAMVSILMTDAELILRDREDDVPFVARADHLGQVEMCVRRVKDFVKGVLFDGRVVDFLKYRKRKEEAVDFIINFITAHEFLHVAYKHTSYSYPVLRVILREAGIEDMRRFFREDARRPAVIWAIHNIIYDLWVNEDLFRFSRNQSSKFINDKLIPVFQEKVVVESNVSSFLDSVIFEVYGVYTGEQKLVETAKSVLGVGGKSVGEILWNASARGSGDKVARYYDMLKSAVNGFLKLEKLLRSQSDKNQSGELWGVVVSVLKKFSEESVFAGDVILEDYEVFNEVENGRISIDEDFDPIDVDREVGSVILKFEDAINGELSEIIRNLSVEVRGNRGMGDKKDYQVEVVGKPVIDYPVAMEIVRFIERESSRFLKDTLKVINARGIISDFKVEDGISMKTRKKFALGISEVFTLSDKIKPLEVSRATVISFVVDVSASVSIGELRTAFGVIYTSILNLLKKGVPVVPVVITASVGISEVYVLTRKKLNEILKRGIKFKTNGGTNFSFMWEEIYDFTGEEDTPVLLSDVKRFFFENGFVLSNGFRKVEFINEIRKPAGVVFITDGEFTEDRLPDEKKSPWILKIPHLWIFTRKPMCDPTQKSSLWRAVDMWKEGVVKKKDGDSSKVEFSARSKVEEEKDKKMKEYDEKKGDLDDNTRNILRSIFLSYYEKEGR